MSASVELAAQCNRAGLAIKTYRLKNDNGLRAEVCELGATLTSLELPGRDGRFDDVVLGWQDPQQALEPTSPFLGATVGRVANRIAFGKCELEGQNLELECNDPPHHLHGGGKGFDKRVWSAAPCVVDAGAGVEFTRVSRSGEQGYPGTVTATVRYLLTNDDSLVVEMFASTDRTTLVNLAHHSYWNLEGHDQGDVLAHRLTLHANSYTPGQPVPDGRVEAVAGTPMDFREGKLVGRDLDNGGANPVGFDHNWVVDGPSKEMRPVARLEAPSSGRVMLLEANQPGVQFYSGNFLDGTLLGKGGTRYRQHAGLCLETQAHPNSINVPAWAGDVILRPGQTYAHRMVHRFLLS